MCSSDLAIVIAVLLRRRSLARQGVQAPMSLWPLLHDALFSGPVVLLLGSLAIGAICGERGYQTMKPLCTDLFQGVLVFFLLDLGVMAGGRLAQLRQNARFLVPFGTVAQNLRQRCCGGALAGALFRTRSRSGSG